MAALLFLFFFFYLLLLLLLFHFSSLAPSTQHSTGSHPT
jgi:hypothetical protein